MKNKLFKEFNDLVDRLAIVERDIRFIKDNYEKSILKVDNTTIHNTALEKVSISACTQYHQSV